MPENYNQADDNGIGTTYVYDPLNRLVTITNGQGEIVQKNIYDITGNIVKVINGKGYLAGGNDNTRFGLGYTYDIGNRIITITTPEAKQQGKTTESFAYDAQNNVITQWDGEGNTTVYH